MQCWHLERRAVVVQHGEVVLCVDEERIRHARVRDVVRARRDQEREELRRKGVEGASEQGRGRGRMSCLESVVRSPDAEPHDFPRYRAPPRAARDREREREREREGRERERRTLPTPSILQLTLTTGVATLAPPTSSHSIPDTHVLRVPTSSGERKLESGAITSWKRQRVCITSHACCQLWYGALSWERGHVSRYVCHLLSPLSRYDVSYSLSCEVREVRRALLGAPPRGVSCR